MHRRGGDRQGVFQNSPEVEWEEKWEGENEGEDLG